MRIELNGLLLKTVEGRKAIHAALVKTKKGKF